MRPPPDLLTVARLPPFLLEPLQRGFSVHGPFAADDAAAQAAAAPRIRAICGSGDSKAGRALIESLPALEIVSIMGDGCDGVDPMADRAFANLQAHFAGQPLPSPVPECRP